MILILIFLFYTSRRVSKRRYAVVLSKILPRFDVWILDAIKDDEYYCILLPMTIVPSILVLYLNWLGMKFYRHN
jgi:phosphatidylinositol N-acetylglucosaminyltransferase subunit Y